MISLRAIEPVLAPSGTDLDADTTTATGTGTFICRAVVVLVDAPVHAATFEHYAEVFLDPLHLDDHFGGLTG